MTEKQGWYETNKKYIVVAFALIVIATIFTAYATQEVTIMGTSSDWELIDNGTVILTFQRIEYTDLYPHIGAVPEHTYYIFGDRCHSDCCWHAENYLWDASRGTDYSYRVKDTYTVLNITPTNETITIIDPPYIKKAIPVYNCTYEFYWSSYIPIKYNTTTQLPRYKTW